VKKRLLILLLFLQLAYSIFACKAIQKQTVVQDGALCFQFEGKNYIIKNGENLNTANCTYYNSLTPSSTMFGINGAIYDSSNNMTTINIIKIGNAFRIGIDEFNNGDFTMTNIHNPNVKIIAQTQKYTSFIFTGDSIKNGIGIKLPNKYTNRNTINN
jgi:hypothetical protein